MTQMSVPKSLTSETQAAEVALERASVKDYIEILKPEINLANLLTAFTGFWLASHGEVQWSMLLVMLIGTLLAVSSGAVLNNILDRDRDRKMPRTAHRALAQGRISVQVAMVLAALMGSSAVVVLAVGLPLVGGNGWLTALLAFTGIVTYGFLYTPLKRVTSLSTVIGGVPGAIPILIGWTAVTGSVDYNGWVLFLMMFFWQLPHFLALAIRKVDDYRAGGFPMYPVVMGIASTKRQILVYALALLPVSLLPAATGLAGMWYLAVATTMGVAFVGLGIYGFVTKDINRWALFTFKFSILYLMVLCVALMFDVQL